MNNIGSYDYFYFRITFHLSKRANLFDENKLQKISLTEAIEHKSFQLSKNNLERQFENDICNMYKACTHSFYYKELMNYEFENFDNEDKGNILENFNEILDYVEEYRKVKIILEKIKKNLKSGDANE